MKKIQTTYRTCPRDGFPLVKIRGRWECVAEYLDRCIGNKSIVDIVQRDKVTHYVFEDGHELPLLCFCCEEPLVFGDADEQNLDEKREMQKRRLNNMAVTFGILDDGTESAEFRLFFAKPLSRDQIEVSVSIGVAARMRHPDDCPHRGTPPKKRSRRTKRRKRKR